MIRSVSWMTFRGPGERVFSRNHKAVVLPWINPTPFSLGGTRIRVRRPFVLRALGERLQFTPNSLRRKSPSLDCQTGMGRELGKPCSRLSFRGKIRLTRPADRANPIFWQFLKGCPCGDPVFRISYGWIINITTYITGVLFHILFSFPPNYL
jgi:hypothetical protein